MRWFAFSLLLLFATSAQAHPWNDAQIGDLVGEARRAPEEGLAIPGTAIATIAALQDLALVNSSFEMQRDAAAEALFRQLARSYAQGQIAPSQADTQWSIATPLEPDYVALDATLDVGVGPATLLRNLLPQSAEYAALRDELARQRLHGASTNEEIVRLRANLERWRWLPRTWPLRRVEVRIPEFKLYLFQRDQPAVTHDVIVGRRNTPTHVFAAQIESVTLNPDWDPPDSIAYRELLPRFRRNPAAAAAEGFEAIDASGQTIDASAVDWQARPFPYRLRQRPGPQNALGQIRFNLPNPFATYLHDTPARGSFGRSNRALSHGCVRVKDPVLLGVEVLSDPTWGAAALQSAIDTGVMQDVPLNLPLPIFLLYLTATTRADGSIVYLNDIYERDSAVVRALDGYTMIAEARLPSAPTCPS